MPNNITWSDIPNATGGDIQTGRNVYIEFKELGDDVQVTKAPSGKIIDLIHEGFMPLFKSYLRVSSQGNRAITSQFEYMDFTEIYNSTGEPVEYILRVGLELVMHAYPDALDKPFSTVERE